MDIVYDKCQYEIQEQKVLVWYTSPFQALGLQIKAMQAQML
jgi:hypothetical protein